ncbi:MAG: hypothetical protein VXX57_04790 [Cyanobacteriota bacterium]|nr:hypothetical protein [Cyanobacteriota bacterium]
MATDSSFSTTDESVGSSEVDEPFSTRAPLTALSGLLIALISFGAPLVAVITDRAISSPQSTLTAKDRHGPSESPSVTLARAGQLDRGDSGREP